MTIESLGTQETKADTATKEHNIGIKRKLALEKEKTFRIELVPFETIIHSSLDPDKIKQGITAITAAVDGAILSIDEWIPYCKILCKFNTPVIGNKI